MSSDTAHEASDACLWQRESPAKPGCRANAGHIPDRWLPAECAGRSRSTMRRTSSQPDKSAAHDFSLKLSVVAAAHFWYKSAVQSAMRTFG